MKGDILFWIPFGVFVMRILYCMAMKGEINKETYDNMKNHISSKSKVE